MDIVVCGVSHRTAPVEMLERISFGPDSHARVLARLTQREDGGCAREAVLLSTCNRVELYAVVPDGYGPEPIARFLADFHGMRYGTLAGHIYAYQGEEAAHHLLLVGAGLDSMILGEPQILGQVRCAYERARKAGAAGPVLSALFRHAIAAAKRVHTETGISQRAASVSYAAVELAAHHLGDLHGRSVLLVGAGKTGQLTAGCLIGRGMREVTVANRTYEAAAALAERLGGKAATLDELPEALRQADIVISATDAPRHLITAAQVAGAMAGRPDRPLVLLDIAVPRDIEPAAGALPGVRLYNLDDLKAAVELNLRDRSQDGQAAQGIVAEELADFMVWFNALSVTPAIVNFRQRAESIRQSELERMAPRLNGLSEHDLDVIDLLTQRIVNRLLHEPTVRLKRYAGRNGGKAYAKALSDLFALNEAGGKE